MKKRILFVDDDPNVLQGLRRMLRQLHDEWSIDFALSSREALEKLSQATFDVVISDMRMPGMDGAQLLNEVKARHPQVVRIVLSGHSNREDILRSVGPAHQYLSKPCDAELLRSTVSRACRLREVLANENILNLVSQLGSLPSLPALYLELVEELQSEGASMQKVGAIIGKDIGMTAKILQLVNSAFFALPRHISTPTEAVVLLGMDTVKALVLSVHVFAKFDQQRLKFFPIEPLLEHSLRTGRIAKAIVAEERLQTKFGDDAVMAGFLHDAGKLVLAANLPEKYAAILAFMNKNRVSLHAAERECFGATHAEVGATLLGLWGLPDLIVEAVALHHNPGAALSRTLSPLTVVHVANVLERETHPAAVFGADDGIDSDYLAALGLTGRLPAWRQLARKLCEKWEAR